MCSFNKPKTANIGLPHFRWPHWTKWPDVLTFHKLQELIWQRDKVAWKLGLPSYRGVQHGNFSLVRLFLYFDYPGRAVLLLLLLLCYAQGTPPNSAIFQQISNLKTVLELGPGICQIFNFRKIRTNKFSDQHFFSPPTSENPKSNHFWLFDSYFS